MPIALVHSIELGMSIALFVFVELVAKKKPIPTVDQELEANKDNTDMAKMVGNMDEVAAEMEIALAGSLALQFELLVAFVVDFVMMAQLAILVVFAISDAKIEMDLVDEVEI